MLTIMENLCRLFLMPHSLQECSRYLTPEQTSQFLDGAIRSRIAVRLIAEQHIALSRALQHPDSMKDHVGVIDLKCRPMDLIQYEISYVVYPFVTPSPVAHAARSSKSCAARRWAQVQR